MNSSNDHEVAVEVVDTDEGGETDNDDVFENEEVEMGPIADKEVDYEVEAKIANALTKNIWGNKEPWRVRRREDGSVKDRGWDDIHSCEFLTPFGKKMGWERNFILVSVRAYRCITNGF